MAEAQPVSASAEALLRQLLTVDASYLGNERFWIESLLATLDVERAKAALGSQAIDILRRGTTRYQEARQFSFREWQNEAQDFVDNLP